MMDLNGKRNFQMGLVLAILLVLSCAGGKAMAQSDLDPSVPDETVKLIFLHHSVGENWLADEQGGLGLALQENNYFVSDTYYGWGPDGIGDRTDTLDWPTWFVGPESQRYLDAVYSESDANAAGYPYYTRTNADPGGENQVIMFKSCYPNSDLGGRPDDAAAPGDNLTVGSAKYAYNQLLTYFSSRPDKLFVVITSPPMQRISSPENVRAVSNWLVNDWLAENAYPHQNVVVFDFYNVLTHPDNHHRYSNSQIEHFTEAGPDTLYYDSWGDDHPSAEGGQKATAEFVPLLNIAVNRWLAGEGQAAGQPVPEPEPAVEEAQESPPQSASVSAATIDDFETGSHPEADYWVTYRDEAVPTAVTCNPLSEMAYQGSNALQIDFDVLADSWASCELLYYTARDWRSAGLQFYLRSSQAGLPFGLLFYYQLGAEKATSVVEFETSPESVDGWMIVSVPWEEFARQDSLVYPESGLGLAFVFGGGADGASNTGTIWIDEIALYADGEEPAEEEVPAAENDIQPPEDVPSPDEPGQGGLPFCSNLPLVVGLVAAGWVGLRRRKSRANR